LSAPLSIAILADTQEVSPLLAQYLSAEPHVWRYFSSQSEFLAHVESDKQELDCLVFYTQCQLQPALDRLTDLGIVLPVAIVDRSVGNTGAMSSSSPDSSGTKSGYKYQPSAVILPAANLSEIGSAIDKAISKFLKLPSPPSGNDPQPTTIETGIAEPNFLLQKQRRLSDKLKERLGYLAIYYKRNPHQFFRQLDRQQKQELLTDLKSQYRNIVLDYFSESSGLNETIDEFVSRVFFTDLSVSEIVKIHMELMEEFSKQLKLEGRSEEILLDYRLTLIDVIAHLCEMYRRSVPQEL
jgi:circadian clock protein KaiA